MNLRLVVAAAACVCGGSGDAGVPLRSQVLPASKQVVAEHGKFGEFKTMLCGETRSVSELLTGVAVIEPGQEIHPPHQHAEEEFVLLAKGSGTWHLDGKDSPAREGDLLYVAPWVVHGLTNTSSAPLTFVVVKWNGKGVAKAEKPKESASGATDSTPTKQGDSKSAAPKSGDASTSSNPEELKSCVLRHDDVKPDADASIGDVRRYWNGATTRTMSGIVSGVATLAPGKEVHPPHQHAEEEFVYVVKGAGTWHLDGKDVAAGAGDLLYAEPWTLHGLTNSGREPLTFYILKWNGRGVAVAEKPAAK